MALLDEWQAPEPSPYFDVRLQARLREEKAAKPSGWLQWVRTPCAWRFAGGHDGGERHFQCSATAAAEPADTMQQQRAGYSGRRFAGARQNHELYSDFEVLDDLQVQQDVNANP